jgi:hypothetical protein
VASGEAGASTKPALLLTGTTPDGESPCALVIDDGGTVRVVRVVGCVVPATVRLLPANSPAAATADTPDADEPYYPPPGWVDRKTFATPGTYRVNQALVDTRTLTVSARPESSREPQ